MGTQCYATREKYPPILFDSPIGTCHSCKQDLPRIEVSSSDFEALQREFLEKALIGDNVYLKSNPQEVETFCDFMQENAPFDVVLDALNIAFTSKNLSKSRQLREVVHYFARKRHMRVLVLGRAHMLKWSADDMKYIRRHAKTFFTDNISSDDPFCLYAALYSGKHCLFVSRDFMRNHKFNMGLRWKDVFERWQKSRQIFHLWVERNHVSVKVSG
nr:hypothetical protein BaRGS_006879 [Batillaria attramentaria]